LIINTHVPVGKEYRAGA